MYLLLSDRNARPAREGDLSAVAVAKAEAEPRGYLTHVASVHIRKRLTFSMDCGVSSA